MKEKELKLLEFLYEKKLTYNELLNTLNIRKESLNKYLNDLKFNGYDWYKKYYSDGTTRIDIFDYTNSEDNSISIITRPDEEKIKTLVISDLHLGCTIERLDLLDKTFNFASKEGIHIIFGCGDLIDGVEDRSAAKNTIPDIHNQIEYLIKNYPYDKNILTFAVLGDHEGRASRRNSVDIAKIINNSRNDVIISEQSHFCINIKNEAIKLKHISELRDQEKINIFGHTHKYMASLHTNVNSFGILGNARVFDKNLMITAPSLSNGNQGMPSMLEMEIYFESGYISEANLKEYGYFGRDKEMILLSEANYSFLLPCVEDELIYNEENYEEEKIIKKIKKIVK